MRKFFTGLTFLLLAGCKIASDVSVSTDQLRAQNPEPVTADLYVELTSCSDFEDSRNPSDSLVEVQTSIPELFRGAEFVSCFKKKFDSIAHFSFPVGITKDHNQLSSDINLVSNENALIALAADTAFIERLDRQESDNLISYDYEMRITVNADSAFDTKVYGVWLDGQPVVYGEANIPAGASFSLKPSDVTISTLLTNGYVRLVDLI
jgi:hypothetical protein